MCHIANVILYTMEPSTIIHLSFTSSLSILSSSYAHFEKTWFLRPGKLKMLILVIPHALKVALS